MKKVFISNLLPQSAVKLCKESGFAVEMWNSQEPIDEAQLIDRSTDIDGLLCTVNVRIDENYIKNAKRLKIISTMSVGYDHIDLSIAKSRDIKIGYTPGVLTDATAELAVGLLLSVSRRLIEGVECAKNGNWGAWKPYWMCGYGLKNSSIGIVGLGNIGKAIATRLQPFGVKQFFASSSDHSKCNKEITIANNLVVKMMNFDTLLTSSDFIIASCSLNDKTKELFNESAFSRMKSHAIFINISRGGVVDQQALFNALKNKKIAGAGLDVSTPEPLPSNHNLFTLNNCVILPHLGSATIETRDAMCDLAVSNLINGLLGRDMLAELKL